MTWVCVLSGGRGREEGKKVGGEKNNSRMCFSRSKIEEEARWVEKLRLRTCQNVCEGGREGGESTGGELLMGKE